MNIPLSLLIYNPIEAYTLVLLCDIITGSRTEFNRKLFPYLFVYSDINFLIQYFLNFKFFFNIKLWIQTKTMKVYQNLTL